MAKILITAIGSFSADYAIKTLKRHGHEIIGTDIYPKEWIANALIVDYFYEVPHSNIVDESDYIKCVLNICIDRNVDYIIPLTDPEVDILSQSKSLFCKFNIKICTPNSDVVSLCRDKYKLPKYLDKQKFTNIIPTELLNNVDDIKSPVFLKPIRGRSSSGCVLVKSNDEFVFFKNKLKNEQYIVQPFIEGNVITVDVVRDPKTHDIVCVARRELLRTTTGAGTTIEIIQDDQLDILVKKIASITSIIGTVNMEFLETNTGQYYLLEINPRFSAGIVFTDMAGYDMVINHLNCFIPLPISLKYNIQKLIISRKYNEYITKII